MILRLKTRNDPFKKATATAKLCSRFLCLFWVTFFLDITTCRIRRALKAMVITTGKTKRVKMLTKFCISVIFKSFIEHAFNISLINTFLFKVELKEIIELLRYLDSMSMLTRLAVNTKNRTEKMKSVKFILVRLILVDIATLQKRSIVIT